MTVGNMLKLLAGSVGLRFAGAGISLLTQLVLTRSFPQNDVGVIFLGMSWAAVFSLIVAAGYPLLALTQLPRFFTLGLKQLVRAFHGAFFRDLIVLCALIYVGVAVFSGFVIQETGTKVALIFGAVSAFPSALLRYNASLANSLRRFHLAFVPDFIFRPGLFFLYIAFAFLLGWSLSVVHVLTAFVVCNTIVAVVHAFILRRDGVHLADWNAVRSKLTHVLRQRAYALAIVGAVTVMFADMVTLIGGFILPHEEVAVLGLTVRLAGIAGFVIQATQQFILPDLTSALTRREEKQANALLVRLNILTILTLASGLIFAVFFGGYFLSFFGAEYRSGHYLLVLFLIGQSIRALSGMNQNLLSIGGHQMRSAGACLIGMAILIVIWLLLEPQLGFISVGYAVIAAELAWALMLAAQVQSLMGRRGDLLWLMLKS